MLMLAKDGDSFERAWSVPVLDVLPSYEEFWRKHIVPLTFRNEPPPVRSHFIKPGLPQPLINLTDRHYATFYHLGHCALYTERIDTFVRGQGPGSRGPSALTPTEFLFSFFAHVVSANDSAAHFGDAVNKVLTRYGAPPLFEFHQSKDVPKHLKTTPRYRTIKPRSLPRRFLSAVGEAKTYRNELVHERIMFLQNGYIPRRDLVGEYGGLSAISKLARDRDRFDDTRSWDRLFVSVTDETRRLLASFGADLELIWKASITALDRLAETRPQYRDEGEGMAPGDSRVTPEAIQAVRELGLNAVKRVADDSAVNVNYNGYGSKALLTINTEQINWDAPAAIRCSHCNEVYRAGAPGSGSYASTSSQFEMLMGPLTNRNKDLLMVILFDEPRDPGREQRFSVVAPDSLPTEIPEQMHRYFFLSHKAWKVLELDEITGSDHPIWPDDESSKHFLSTYLNYERSKWSYDAFLAWTFHAFRPNFGYVTNVAKCHFGAEYDRKRMQKVCSSKVLARELAAIQPNLVISMSDYITNAKDLQYRTEYRSDGDLVVLRWYHTAARVGGRKKRQRMIESIRDNESKLKALGVDTGAVLELLQ